MSETLFYFAYGSNMSSKRLEQRVPSAKAISPAKLSSHRLKFHKVGQDGSGKCDIEHTGEPQDFVMGVIYEVPISELPALDKAEGLGAGYEKKDVSLHTHAKNELITAFTYYATHIDQDVIPFDWYKEHVLIGAEEHQLPVAYIQSAVTSITAKPDPDKDRHKKELQIYQP